MESALVGLGALGIIHTEFKDGHVVITARTAFKTIEFPLLSHDEARQLAGAILGGIEAVEKGV